MRPVSKNPNEGGLDVCHPLRLGVVLNLACFNYEVKSDPNKAIGIARDTFDEAIAELGNVPDENYKDASMIM